MAVDINQILTRKYDILGQQAQAATTGAQAGMLTAQTGQQAERARAPLYAAEAQNQLAQGYATRSNADTMRMGEMARAPLYGAQARLTDTQASVLPSTAAADIGLHNAQAGQIGAQTNAMYRTPTDPFTASIYQYRLEHPGEMLPGNYFGAGQPGAAVVGGHYAGGTSQVQGPGGPTEDKVAAKLSPDEAVLNAGAAEHLGRPIIQALNAVGLMKMGMGMVAPHASTEDDRTKVQEKAQTTGKTGAYAKGTSKAAGKGKGGAHKGKGAPQPKAQPSDTPTDPSQIDPQALMAALQMGQMGQQLQAPAAPAAPPQGMPMGGMI